MRFLLPAFPGLFLCLVLSSCRHEGALVDEVSYTEQARDPQFELLKGTDSLTLDRAKELALRNNPTLLEAASALEAAKFRYYQALGAYSPSVFTGVSVGQDVFRGPPTDGYSVSDNTFFSYSLVQANWVVFDGLSREFNLVSSIRNRSIRTAMEEDSKRILLRGVAYAWNNILLAEEQKRIALADLEFQQDMLKDSELRRKAGTASRADVLNFRGKVISAKESMVSAEYQCELGTFALANLMGYRRGALPPGLKLRRGEIERRLGESLEPDPDLLLNLALANRPDLKIFREKLRLSEAGLWKSWGAFLPKVSAFAGYSNIETGNSSSAGNIAGQLQIRGNSFDYGVNASLVLFNGFARYNAVREARENLRSTELEGAAKWLAVVQDVRSSAAEFRQCRKLLALSRENLRVLEQQRDDVAREYRAGSVGITRLNEAQLNYVRASAAAASSLFKLSNAAARLDAAVSR